MGSSRPGSQRCSAIASSRHVESAALLHVRQRTDLGGVALTWDWYGQRNPQFPRGTPLYISSQDDLGEVHLDPYADFTRKSSAAASPRRYRLKLNLWYTPEETNCGIHTGHEFLEVHTQVLGTGHMQKFRENNADTLYEDVPMLPGYTHDPFFTLASDGSFSYPWHRYYADTDCIWMAIESASVVTFFGAASGFHLRFLTGVKRSSYLPPGE